MQEPSISSKDSEDSITVTNETVSNKCNACNKIFKTNQNLENHIEAVHSEKQCNYCNLTCSNEKDLVEHHGVCSEIGVANVTCKNCSQVFTKQGLKRHQPCCKEPKKDMDCYECGEMFSNLTDLMKHKDEAHKMEQVTSRVICKHWKKGRCNKGDSCGFSHAGHQSTNPSSTTERNSTKLKACRNGPSCDWLKRGNCNFFHAQAKSQGGRQGRQQENQPQGGRQDSRAQGGRQDSRPQGGRQDGRTQGGRQKISQPDRDQCQFDGRCERIPNCPYIHSLEDFPLLQGRKQPVRIHSNNQRRN